MEAHLLEWDSSELMHVVQEARTDPEQIFLAVSLNSITRSYF